MQNIAEFIDAVAALQLSRKALEKTAIQHNLSSRIKWQNKVKSLSDEIDAMLNAYYTKKQNRKNPPKP